MPHMTQQEEIVPELNTALESKAPTNPNAEWWGNGAEGPQPLKFDLEAPMPKAEGTKKPVDPTKVKRGGGLIFFTVILRVLGFFAGFAMCATGGWIVYKITDAGSAKNMIQFAAFGVFLLLCGFLTVMVECRTKKMMRGCVNTYVIISSYLARGLLYVGVGGLIFAITDFQFPPPYVKLAWIAGGIIGIGGLNLVFYPFHCRWSRKAGVAKANPPKIAHAEEVVYDMDIYDPAKKAAVMEKLKEKEPVDHVSIPVAPAAN